ncbi:MAG: hypothetical protein M0Q95_17915 [Porticoccaceae bacterium]|nr:hypothetical protein [Porticoccaceae bacterium]
MTTTLFLIGLAEVAPVGWRASAHTNAVLMALVTRFLTTKRPLPEMMNWYGFNRD